MTQNRGGGGKETAPSPLQNKDTHPRTQQKQPARRRSSPGLAAFLGTAKTRGGLQQRREAHRAAPGVLSLQPGQRLRVRKAPLPPPSVPVSARQRPSASSLAHPSSRTFLNHPWSSKRDWCQGNDSGASGRSLGHFSWTQCFWTCPWQQRMSVVTDVHPQPGALTWEVASHHPLLLRRKSLPLLWKPSGQLGQDRFTKVLSSTATPPSLVSPCGPGLSHTLSLLPRVSCFHCSSALFFSRVKSVAPQAMGRGVYGLLLLILEFVFLFPIFFFGVCEFSLSFPWFSAPVTGTSSFSTPQVTLSLTPT